MRIPGAKVRKICVSEKKRELFLFSSVKILSNKRAQNKEKLDLFVMPSESIFGEAKGTDFFPIFPLLRNNSVFLQQRWCEI